MYQLSICVLWDFWHLLLTTIAYESLSFSRRLEHNKIIFIPDGFFQELKSLRNLWVPLSHSQADACVIYFAYAKLSADPLGYRLVDPQLLWQCDDETGQTNEKQMSIC